MVVDTAGRKRSGMNHGIQYITLTTAHCRYMMVSNGCKVIG